MIKVLIADDQELIRESLKIVLGANEDMVVTSKSIHISSNILYTFRNSSSALLQAFLAFCKLFFNSNFIDSFNASSEDI